MSICTNKQPNADLASNRLHDVPRILTQYPMGYTSLKLHLITHQFLGYVYI